MELYEALQDIGKGRFYDNGCDYTFSALASGVYNFEIYFYSGEIKPLEIVVNGKPSENAETLEREFYHFMDLNRAASHIYSLSYSKIKSHVVYAILGNDENGEEKELFTGTRDEIETLYKEIKEKYTTENNGIVLITKKGVFTVYGYGSKATTKEIHGILTKSDIKEVNADTLPEYSEIPADELTILTDEAGAAWIKYNDILYRPHKYHHHPANFNYNLEAGEAYTPYYYITVNGINRKIKV